MRPHIWHGAPSSKLAIPPQDPSIGLLFVITPIANKANEPDKTIIPSITSIRILNHTIFVI